MSAMVDRQVARDDLCQLCEAEVAARGLVVDLRPGDTIAFAGNLAACEKCIELVLSNEDGELASRLAPIFDSPASAAQLLRMRTVRVEALPAPLPMDSSLRAQGYQPLHDYTGVGDELGPLWPVDFSKTLPIEIEPDATRRWYVRSPWPSLSVAQVLELLWPHVMRDPFVNSAWSPRVMEVFAWSEREAEASLRSLRGGG